MVVCVCVSLRARLCVGCVHVCHCVCFAVSHLLVDSLFVCPELLLGCVCVCVFYLSGCLSLCLVWLVSVDLLVLSSSTCTAVLLPRTCLGGEKKVLTLLAGVGVSGLIWRWYGS